MSGEREREMVERLHRAWHPAPNTCTPHRACYERRRAESTVRLLGQMVARWVAEEVEQAKASLVREWGA